MKNKTITTVESSKDLLQRIDSHLGSINVKGDDVEKMYFARIMLKQIYASLEDEEEFDGKNGVDK